jgi:hypothetical protein
MNYTLILIVVVAAIVIVALWLILTAKDAVFVCPRCRRYHDGGIYVSPPDTLKKAAMSNHCEACRKFRTIC